MAKLTYHAKKRIGERVGATSKGSAKLNATKAYVEGIRHNETTGELHSWMDGHFLHHKKGSDMRLFRGYLYVFNQKTLITVFAIPEKFETHMNLHP